MRDEEDLARESGVSRYIYFVGYSIMGPTIHRPSMLAGQIRLKWGAER